MAVTEPVVGADSMSTLLRYRDESMKVCDVAREGLKAAGVRAFGRASHG